MPKPAKLKICYNHPKFMQFINFILLSFVVIEAMFLIFRSYDLVGNLDLFPQDFIGYKIEGNLDNDIRLIQILVNVAANLGIQYWTPSKILTSCFIGLGSAITVVVITQRKKNQIPYKNLIDYHLVRCFIYVLVDCIVLTNLSYFNCRGQQFKLDKTLLCFFEEDLTIVVGVVNLGFIVLSICAYRSQKILCHHPHDQVVRVVSAFMYILMCVYLIVLLGFYQLKISVFSIFSLKMHLWLPIAIVQIQQCKNLVEYEGKGMNLSKGMLKILKKWRKQAKFEEGLDQLVL